VNGNFELRIASFELQRNGIRYGSEGPWAAVPIRNSKFVIRNCRKAFTLIEMMVSIGILLVLGVMIISLLRGALTMTRTGTARGQQFETAQTVLRTAEADFSQILGLPAHPDGPDDDPAFRLMDDPFGRQMIAFTRAWGEEQGTLAGYDSARGSAEQGYAGDFDGRNVGSAIRASHGNIEVVYLIEPTRDGDRLFRAERSPPDLNNGLITRVASWCQNSPKDELSPMALMQDANNEYALDGKALWSQFELVAENVLAFSVECWDDWDRTTSWNQGPSGPVTTWSIYQRQQEGKYALPRALRITLVVASEQPLRAETTLSAGLGESDTSVYVDDADAFPDSVSPSSYLRVGGEMIAYGSRSGRTFGSCVRGALGSRPQAHGAGARVMAGEAFQRVI